MEKLWQDLCYSARVLRTQPGFALVAIVTLALGIGANTVIFSVVNAVLLTPLPYAEPERLVMLWERNPATGMEQEMVTPPNLADWQAAQHVFSQMAWWTGDVDYNLVGANVGEDGSEKIRVAFVSASLFSTLGAQPLAGRALPPEEDQPEGNRAAVIGYEFARQRYGDINNAPGKTLSFDTYGRRDYEIVGVMPPGFQFPGKCAVWLAAGWNGIPRNRRGGHWLTVMARLDTGVTLARARAEMNAIQAGIFAVHAAHNVGSQVLVTPLLEQTVGRNLQMALWVLWAAIAAVLLIACVNVANLTLARAMTRQKEIVIRLALGASRWQVVAQMLLENLWVALCGAALGWLLAWWALNALRILAGEQIPRLQTVRLDWRALLFTLLIVALTIVLSGLAPAWAATRPNLLLNLNAALKEGGRNATAGLKSNRMRGALVIAEIALAMLLVTGAGLMISHLTRLLNLNRGFQSAQLLVAKLDFSVSGFTTWTRPTATRPQVTLRELMQRLQSQPGVQSVAAVNGLARGTAPPRQGIVFASRQFAETRRADYQAISPDYFRTMGIPLLQGRAFTEQDTLESPGVVIISETLARQVFPDVNPIGQRMAMEGRTPGQPAGAGPGAASPWSEIVGVVADTKRLTLAGNTVPTVYAPYWQWPMQTPELLIRVNGNAGPVATAIRQELKALNKNIPAPLMQTMESQLADLTAPSRLQTALLTLFGLLALTLAAAGIYSVMAHSTAQRTNEIGIRMALGADARAITQLVIGQGIKLILPGIALGLAGALALTRALKSLLSDMNTADPLTLIGAVILLLVIAILACWIPARRAARLDPLMALRNET